MSEKLELQNPDVLEADDIGYCMDENGKWYRWKKHPTPNDTEWIGQGAGFIHSEDTPDVDPTSIDWRTSWTDNPNYVKPEKSEEEATTAILDEAKETYRGEQSVTMDLNWEKLTPVYDEVNKAKHYNQNPSGVECITVIEHFQCNIAAAMKYLWRAGEKHDDPLMDLEKAEYYVKRQIALYHFLKEKS